MKAIFIFLLVTLPLVSMEPYHRKRDQILGHYLKDPQQIRALDDQQKDSLLDVYHKSLHNGVARMRKAENEEISPLKLLTMAATISCVTWDIYSKNPDSSLLFQCCLCGSNAIFACGSIAYGIIDVCHSCHKRKFTRELKTVQDLLFERDMLLYQD